MTTATSDCRLLIHSPAIVLIYVPAIQPLNEKEEAFFEKRRTDNMNSEIRTEKKRKREDKKEGKNRKERERKEKKKSEVRLK